MLLSQAGPKHALCLQQRARHRTRPGWGELSARQTCLQDKHVCNMSARPTWCRRSLGSRINAIAQPADSAAQQGQQPVDLDAEFDKQLRQILEQMDPDGLMDDYDVLLEGGNTSGSGSSSSGSSIQPPVFGSTAEQDEDDFTTESGLPSGIQLTRREYKQRAGQLAALLTSEPAEFDQRLAAVRANLDEATIAMVDKRLEAAATHQKGQPIHQQLQQLSSLLHLEWERAQATPAMRLLDDVLDLLGDDRDATDMPQRQQDVATRLRDAFSGGAMSNLDVFAAAEALAAAGPLAAEALRLEAVSQEEFMQEATALLRDAQQQADALQQSVTKAQEEIQTVRNRDPALLQTREAVAHMQRVHAAEEALLGRKAALAQLQVVVQIAASLQLPVQPLRL